MYITSTGGWTTSKPCVAQITKKKNRLKVYPSTKDQVYLNDGDEFEIELFNPKTSPVLAKISINGKRISERGIILNPGQRVFLERFLDSPDKLKFSTYNVNNSTEVKEAIANNGLVKIEFYEEYVSYQGFYSGTGTGTTTTWATHTNPITYTNTNAFYNSNLNETTSGSFTLTSGIFNSSIAGSLDTAPIKKSKRADSLETGRVEEGSRSDQNFENGQGNFNSYSSNVVEYQILPISQKNIEAKEIRSYCTECGTRNKQDWKFCPTCGNKF
jgi:hypothetical protein